MKKFGNVIKKIFALGVGALMIGTTVGAAMSATYNLGSFPEPFTKNGQFSGYVVVGTGTTTAPASVEDVLGAADVMAALQAANVKTETITVPGTGNVVSIDDGVKISSNGNELNFDYGGDTLFAVDGKIDDSDLPDFLASDYVVDENVENKEYLYDLEIVPGAIPLAFDNPDDDTFNGPVINLDIDGAAVPLYTAIIDFKDALEVENDGVTIGDGLDNSETINLFGKSYTFKADITNGDDLVLYGSDVSTFLDLNEPKTITVDGEQYVLEVVGGSSDANPNNVIIDVNGVRKTVVEGQQTTINGLEIFIQDLFVTNIPTLSASANVFVGSQELVIPAAASAAACPYRNFNVNGERIDGVKVCVVNPTAGRFDAIDEIRFQVSPQEFEDGIDWMVKGDEIEDPLFKTFKFVFEGPSEDFDSEDRDLVELRRSGSKYMLDFTNKDGQDYSFAVIEEEGDLLHIGDNVGVDADDLAAAWGPLQEFDINAGEVIAEDTIFIASEGVGTTEEVTKIYQVIEIDDIDNEVTFEDLSDGSEIVVKGGDELEDTGLFVADKDLTDAVIDAAETTFAFATTAAGTVGKATLNYIITDNDMQIDLGDVDQGTNAAAVSGAVPASWTVTFTEDINGKIVDEMGFDQFDVVFGLDGTDSNIEITTGVTKTGAGANSLVMVADDDADYEYGVTELGTYIVEEIDRDGDYVKIYTNNREVYYNMFLGVEGSQIVGGSSGGTYTTQTIVTIVDATVTDQEMMNMGLSGKNIVSVGGPAVNRVSANLMGKTFPAYADESGVPKDAAMIKLFQANDNVRIVVAGWEAANSRIAATVLSKYKNYASQLAGKSDVVISGTTESNVQISVPQ